MRSTNIKKLTNCYRTCIHLVAFGLLFLCSYISNAQGWEMYFGGANDDVAQSVLEVRDHGYLFVGSTQSFGSAGFNIYVVRTDVDGKQLWQTTLGGAVSEFGHDVVEAHDGGYIVVGETVGGGQFGLRDVYMAKIDSLGNLLWETSFGSEGDDRGLGVIATSDGGYAISGSREVLDNQDVYIIKTDADGNLLWESNFGSVQDDVGQALVETPDGDFIIAGFTGDNANSDVYIVKFGADQTIKWANTYGSNENDQAFDIIRTTNDEYVIAGKINSVSNDYYLIRLADGGNNANLVFIEQFGDGAISEEARSVQQTKDGGFILSGFAEVDAVNIQAELVKTDANGQVEWSNRFGRGVSNFANSVIETAQGAYLMVGNTTATLIGEGDILMIKADTEGNIFTNYVEGNVFYDLMNDCQYDGDEEGVKRWVVKAEGDRTFYGTTDELGNYSILVDQGAYNVSIVRPNEFWQSCVESFLVNFTDPYMTLIRNFPVLADLDCTDLEVDVSAPFLKNCEEAVYNITYCNHGTIEAEDIRVDLIISKNLDYISVDGASLSGFGDSLYLFDVSDLDIGECGNFKVRVNVDCNAVIGETHCIKAHVTPDEICLPDDPAWDGSSLQVDGYCDSDSVRFKITNVGEAMNQSVEYVVIEDIVIGLQQNPTINLASGESVAVAYPADGRTYRLNTQQSEGHPGGSRPTIAVEGCLAGGGPDFSTGIYNQLPEDDYDHFRAADCQENILIDSFPTQVKRGYPKGYGDSMKIASNTDLKYHIKFQNTGIDTAIRVVIRDTLSPFLDAQSVRLGASSHDYEFEVYGEGILKITFNNIELEDSSANEVASHGFIKYRVSQKPDNPVGVEIKNRAAVYFDYDVPSNTGDVCHLVAGMDWNEFILVSDQEIFVPEVDIRVYPNPFTDFTRFEIEGILIKNLYFNVYDLNGRLVRSEQHNSNNFELQRRNLTAGMYVYRIIGDDQQLISTGKLVVN